jgi:hypothetical protein
MAKANVTLIEAQMGEGKTNTATAIMIDKYFNEIYAIRSNQTFKTYLVKPYRLEVVKLPIAGKSESRLIEIPKGWETFSTGRLFCNFHLFGVKFIYGDPAFMVRLLNTGFVSNGILVVDEGYIAADSRRGMGAMSVMYTWFGQQMRKRNIELYILVQHGRFIDWRFRFIAKRKILTHFNEKTHMIHLLIQNLVKGTEKATSFYAPQYWKYYDTNELPPMPQQMIAKASGGY